MLIKLLHMVLISTLLITAGCVTVKIPEDLPENTSVHIEVFVSGYKSAAGQGNLLEVKTDATLPLLRQSMGAAEPQE